MPQRIFQSIHEEAGPAEKKACAAKRRDDAYAQSHPEANDVLIVIEVADSSRERDERLKLPTYARHGIGEYWLVALETREFHVYTEPYENTYRKHTVVAFDTGSVNSTALDREISIDLTFLRTNDSEAE